MQEQLLPKQEEITPAREIPENSELIVVLKQHRFYKQLCIELYEAPLTQAGKIKNPLTLVSPLEMVWKATDPDKIKFFTAITHFQNNPATGKSAADIDALKVLFKNPLGLTFYYHNPEFSESVSAGALVPVKTGSIVRDLSLQVNSAGPLYELSLEVTVKEQLYAVKDLEIKYDYFILLQDHLHLMGTLHILQLIHYFRKHRPALKIPEAKYKEFHQKVLTQLEDRITISYSYIQAATNDQVEQTNLNQPGEKIIYLSDLGSYVMINPVMKYGNIEIPIRTKRQIKATDTKGKLFIVERNHKAEEAFQALIVRQHPFFFEQLEEEFTYFYLHKKHFLEEDWFLNVFEEWNAQGISVLGFNQLKENKLNANKAKITIHVTSGLNWFNTDMDVRFGKRKASIKQLHQAVRNKTRFVKLDDGTLGILPQEWLNKFTEYFQAGEVVKDSLVTPKINFASVAELYEAAALDDEVKEEIRLYRSKFSEFDAIKEVEPPAELNAALRHYQKQGLNWLNFLDDFNFGGCLADDMGLGKTVQILAFILLQRHKVKRNTNLVVVPTSLIFNWQKEVQKLAPSIRLYNYYGSDRVKGFKVFDEHEIILTSYGTLVSDAHFLKSYEFNYVFLDESQNIKNIDSQRYQAARLLKSRNKIAITGTPIENNTFDLYGQLSFACPGLLGNRQYFRDIYSIPIDKFKSIKRAAELKQKVAPFILRRTKQQVADELPDKTEMVLYCPMGEQQRKAYDACEQEFREYLEGKTGEEFEKSPLHVLRELTRLRQICNSPLLLPDEKLHGAGSSKIEILMEEIENRVGQHKILIFSQFVSMLDLIKKELKYRNIAYEYLTGQTEYREAVVHSFQNNKDVRVFLISLKAGGTGLNLTEGDYVYLVDPWWNPAVENQAIDRSYRIGQKKNVVAVRLICPDTIEEKIMKLQETKRTLSDDLIKTDSTLFNALSKSDLLSLLT